MTWSPSGLQNSLCCDLASASLQFQCRTVMHTHTFLGLIQRLQMDDAATGDGDGGVEATILEASSALHCTCCRVVRTTLDFSAVNAGDIQKHVRRKRGTHCLVGVRKTRSEDSMLTTASASNVHDSFTAASSTAARGGSRGKHAILRPFAVSRPEVSCMKTKTSLWHSLNAQV